MAGRMQRPRVAVGRAEITPGSGITCMEGHPGVRLAVLMDICDMLLYLLVHKWIETATPRLSNMYTYTIYSESYI